MHTTVFNSKGGTGKTTLAIHLARELAKQGQTLLVDRDPQGSSMAWATLAENTPFALSRNLTGHFQHVVYDMPPTTATLPECDLVVVPTLLDGASFVAFIRLMKQLQDQPVRVLPVAMRVNPKRGEHKARLGHHLLKGAAVIRERAAFATYYAMGSTVQDMQSPHIEKARRDIDGLMALIGATP